MNFALRSEGKLALRLRGEATQADGHYYVLQSFANPFANLFAKGSMSWLRDMLPRLYYGKRDGKTILPLGKCVLPWVQKVVKVFYHLLPCSMYNSSPTAYAEPH
jgi:hypothetical protein